MNKVVKLHPLSDIPGMLRQWADDLESGAEPMPRTVLMVMVHDADTPPVICELGQELPRLHEIGALTAAAQLMMRTELVPDDG